MCQRQAGLEREGHTDVLYSVVQYVREAMNPLPIKGPVPEATQLAGGSLRLW